MVRVPSVFAGILELRLRAEVGGGARRGLTLSRLELECDLDQGACLPRPVSYPHRMDKVRPKNVQGPSDLRDSRTFCVINLDYRPHQGESRDHDLLDERTSACQFSGSSGV